MSRWRTASTLAMSGLLAAACSGPHAKVTIGGTTEQLDVAFGGPKAATTAPRGRPTTLVPAPNGVGLVPVPTDVVEVVTIVDPGTGAPPVPPPDPSCPALGSTATSRFAADPVVSGMPHPGRYPLRFSGRLTDGATTRVVRGTGHEQISPAASSATGTQTFSVTTQLLGATTTFTYLVVPPSPTVEGKSAAGQVDLQSATGSGGLGYAAAFRPDVPLELFPMPATARATWSGRASDASSGAVATLDGTVGAHGPVNACGRGIDAWRTAATLHALGGQQDLTTDLTTFVATQYGGLPVEQVEHYSGTVGGRAVSGDLTWVLSADPGQA